MHLPKSSVRYDQVFEILIALYPPRCRSYRKLGPKMGLMMLWNVLHGYIPGEFGGGKIGLMMLLCVFFVPDKFDEGKIGLMMLYGIISLTKARSDLYGVMSGCILCPE